MYLNKGVKNSVGICVKLGMTMIIVQLIFIFIFSFFNLPESMVKKVCNMEKYQVKSQYLDYTQKWTHKGRKNIFFRDKSILKNQLNIG